MKHHYSVLALNFLILFSSPNTHAEQIYQWVGEDGKRYFSDRPSKNEAFVKTEIKDIPAINLVKIKPITLTKTRKPKKRKQTANQCQQTKQKIAKLEQKLSLKNIAAKFDQFNQQLSELRWKKLKHC